MIVCVCRRITDHQIRQAVAEGAESLECLQFELGVATQCGRCGDCASQLLRDACGLRQDVAPREGVFAITVVRTAELQGA